MSKKLLLGALLIVPIIGCNRDRDSGLDAAGAQRDRQTYTNDPGATNAALFRNQKAREQENPNSSAPVPNTGPGSESHEQPRK